MECLVWTAPKQHGTDNPSSRICLSLVFIVSGSGKGNAGFGSILHFLVRLRRPSGAGSSSVCHFVFVSVALQRCVGVVSTFLYVNHPLLCKYLVLILYIFNSSVSLLFSSKWFLTWKLVFLSLNRGCWRREAVEWSLISS